MILIFNEHWTILLMIPCWKRSSKPIKRFQLFTQGSVRVDCLISANQSDFQNVNMKFVNNLLLSSLYIGFISAQFQERTWGNINTTVLGRQNVVKIDDTREISITFTYPDVRGNIDEAPNKYPIVGIKLVDKCPTTQVEFVKGKLGDKEITIKLTSWDHDIRSNFTFYRNPWRMNISRLVVFIVAIHNKTSEVKQTLLKNKEKFQYRKWFP